jgi:hypothetical protein
VINNAQTILLFALMSFFCQSTATDQEITSSIGAMKISEFNGLGCCSQRLSLQSRLPPSVGSGRRFTGTGGIRC